MTDHKYEYLGRRAHATIVGMPGDSVWERAALHRAHVLRLLPNGDGIRRGIICVVGVGDGTGLDLRGLLARFHEVHLVDADEERTRQAIRNQNLDDRQRIFHHVCEMTGLEHWLTGEVPKQDQDWIQAGSRRIQEHTFPELGEFDVVLSHCQIPTITAQLVTCLADQPEILAEWIQQVRQRHVELLWEHTVPGGQTILIMDVVSSDTLSALKQLPDDLPKLLTLALQQGNFFPGAHPARMDQLLRQHRQRLRQWDVSQPWVRQTEKEHRISVAFRMLLAHEAGPGEAAPSGKS